MNARGHRKIAVVSGVGIPLAMGICKIIKNYNDSGKIDLRLIEWDKMLMGGVAGLVFSSLPDCIEPATNPNHRKFFHSVAFAGALGGVKYCVNNSNIDSFAKNVINSACNAYLTHLAADMLTPKSLPWSKTFKGIKYYILVR